ncbi:unnamed protein product [Phaedon cochleariae]|uniref:ditrans,polycis-polyprenyl diphosphate synthase [(2E,6E)-farnesyldiphosphate specific] n=1 Tax=Phaedon cochleariae TaxID=80249 RepID=A0A9P0DV98_PHACE|nr:unnamed protein product [Phaedon cochleariae]
MKSANIHTFLYVLIHVIYTIFEWLYGALVICFNFCHEFLPTTDKSKYFREELQKITKKPTHLTVIFGAEEPPFKELTNLILWCLATQISFISFYDYKGNLKKHEEQLQYEVGLQKNETDHITWHSNPKIVHKNGYLGRSIHVKIITKEDGKNSIVNLTKKLAVFKNKDFSIENFSEMLLAQYEFPDPDVGLVCGQTIRLYDYPPWQMRITEFFKLGSIQGITFPKFLEVLVRYSKCEQRLGK